MPSDTRDDETQKNWAGKSLTIRRIHNLHRKKINSNELCEMKATSINGSFKMLLCSLWKSQSLWLGLVVWVFFGHSAWTIRASFTHRHRPQVVTVLWDRVELHALNTIHNLLNSKEDYLCSGCSPYSHPASCLNDEKFQQTTDSKQPSAKTEHENGDFYQWETKAMSTPRAPGHHPLPSRLHSQRGQPSLARPRNSSQAQGWSTLNAEYQHESLRNLHKFRGGNE